MVMNLQVWYTKTIILKLLNLLFLNIKGDFSYSFVISSTRSSRKKMKLFSLFLLLVVFGVASAAPKKQLWAKPCGKSVKISEDIDSICDHLICDDISLNHFMTFVQANKKKGCCCIQVESEEISSE